MGQEKVILFLTGEMPLLEKSLSPQLREESSGIASACFTAGSPGAPGTHGGSPEGAEKVTPWAGPLLLSWAGLLGRRELMASRQRCRETALPRSSSSAKRSRAEGTACRHRGERSKVERG